MAGGALPDELSTYTAPRSLSLLRSSRNGAKSLRQGWVSSWCLWSVMAVFNLMRVAESDCGRGQYGGSQSTRGYRWKLLVSHTASLVSHVQVSRTHG